MLRGGCKEDLHQLVDACLEGVFEFRGSSSFVIILNLLSLLVFHGQIRADSASISIQQDVSKGWLVIRFACANDRLERRLGALGAARVPSSELHLHAAALKSATEKVLLQFAMPEDKMPSPGGKTRRVSVQREGYTKLLGNLIPKLEMLTADGAADEQLTLRMLGKELTGLKLTCKDLAHCSRRIANRSVFADDFLKKVLLGFSYVPAFLSLIPEPWNCHFPFL